jgi:hypothetical protein
MKRRSIAFAVLVCLSAAPFARAGVVGRIRTCTFKGATNFQQYGTDSIEGAGHLTGTCVTIEGDAPRSSAVESAVADLIPVTVDLQHHPLPNLASQCYGGSLFMNVNVYLGQTRRFSQFQFASLIDYPGVQGQTPLVVVESEDSTGQGVFGDRIFGACPASDTWTDQTTLTFNVQD